MSIAGMYRTMRTSPGNVLGLRILQPSVSHGAKGLRYVKNRPFPSPPGINPFSMIDPKTFNVVTWKHVLMLHAHPTSIRRETKLVSYIPCRAPPSARLTAGHCECPDDALIAMGLRKYGSSPRCSHRSPADCHLRRWVILAIFQPTSIKVLRRALPTSYVDGFAGSY